MVSVGEIARRSRASFWSMASLGVLAVGAPAHAQCSDIVPDATTMTPSVRRLVTPEDIVALRDIGQPDASLFTAKSPLAVSPDGTRIAFVINRAMPATNDHCRALVVMDARQGARPRIVDQGGELINLSYVLRELVVCPGFPDLITPVWSPDGRWIAYRKRVGGRTEAWIASAAGGGARRAGELADDVEDIVWSTDGARLVVAVRPGIRAQQAQIAEEGRRGYLYDRRFAPNEGAWPGLRGPISRSLVTIDIATGRATSADTDDARRMPAEIPMGIAAEFETRSPQGRRAWLQRAGATFLSPMRLHAADADGEEKDCSSDACTGSIVNLAWSGEDLIFVRREGWARGSIGLYRWSPGHSQPRRFLTTDDVLSGCVATGVQLVCLAENAATPRRLVLIDPSNGAHRLLYNPNPEFASIQLGKVQRLPIRNRYGLESWVDLVVPPGHAGGKLPLVVVQYHSDGFLRGGTGDEYPVHAFAARGFAVLSFERPADFAFTDPSAVTDERINKVNQEGWRDRWNILSSLETGVRQAIDLGVADPRRIGITGLSDGATTTAFALINSDMFSAAAISSCCLEPHTVMTYGGPAWADNLAARGYPRASKPDPVFWQSMSLAQNAARINTPLLMQIADREYLLALESWTALKEHDQPVEMYVFPDEHHTRWQPAHRLATYERSLDWFDFWLNGRIDADPAKADQYQRWQAMRDRRARRKPGRSE